VRWRRGLSRDEIEERLGTTGGFAIPLRPSRRSGVIWALLFLVVAVLALVGGLPGGGEGGVDLERALQPFPASPRASGRPPANGALVARDVQETWTELFRKAGVAHRPAKLVAFDRVRKSPCGVVVPSGGAAFYCRHDSTLLFDKGLNDAYLVAHGYAHHVQEILGITGQVARAEEASPRQARELWRKHELQADCLAGVWAHSALRRADAAAMMQLATVPVDADHVVEHESWAGAPREQRASWFARGYRKGLAVACNSFGEPGQ
jgi:predicted metalloprotease